MIRFALTLFTGLAFAAGSSAHHGIINFDLNTDLEITGTITEIAFVNPHSWLYLDVTGSDGQVTRWQCELRGATVLRRSGWSPEMFSPGSRITVTGSPDRFEPNTCYLGTAIFADGTRVDRYGQIERQQAVAAERPLLASDRALSLSGDWAAEQRVLTDPRGISGAFLPLSVAEELEPGEVPAGAAPFPGTRGTAVSLAGDPVDAFWNRPSAMALTPAGAAAIEGFDGASSDNPRLRCETTNVLFDWTFEMDVNRIIQAEDRIILLYGSMGLERTIHMDLNAHPDGLTPTRAGHSIGRWEDGTLVVDTVGFEPGILSADGRIPHSDQLHVVEYFTLDPDRQAIDRRYVAVDPLYFEGEYTGSDTVYVSDLPYQGTPCEDRSFRTTQASEESPTAARLWWVLPSALLLAVAAVLLRRGRGVRS